MEFELTNLPSNKLLWISKATHELDCCCCSVAKSCPTVCDATGCDTPGFPVLHYLPELAQIHVQSQWCYLTISSSVALFSSCLQSFPASGSFTMSWSLHQVAKVLTAVLPMNIQNWFPLGLTGLISLLSKELSRVFSSITIRKHQFSGTQPSSWFSSLVHDYWKNHSFD